MSKTDNGIPGYVALAVILLAGVTVVAFCAFSAGVSLGLVAGHRGDEPVETVEVGRGKPVRASSFYQGGEGYSFGPQAVVDRRTDELSCTLGVEQGNTYWLLADHRTGWVEIDLQSEMEIVKVRWLNTHNGDCADRGTTAYRITLSRSGGFDDETLIGAGEMEFTITPKYQDVALPHPITARYVRFYVDGYYAWGGGLNELEVYAVVDR